MPKHEEQLAPSLHAGANASPDRHATIIAKARYNTWYISSTTVVFSGAAGHNKRAQHHSSTLPLLFASIYKVSKYHV